jgi:hypothetical protein
MHLRPLKEKVFGGLLSAFFEPAQIPQAIKVINTSNHGQHHSRLALSPMSFLINPFCSTNLK